MIGEILHSRYQINEKLGTGGFGSTYIAIDIQNNQECVVKKLQPITNELKFLEQARRLFKKEAATLKKLNHNQIPRLFDYFEENEEFYLVQEYVKGELLTNELKLHQIWEESKVIAFLEDSLKILAYIHNQGIIHRDIKPDNFIRRQKDGKLVLIDFGTVKEFNIEQSQVISPTIAVGTRGYMPTEQMKGKPQKNSDIYALGIIAIQACTGFNPMQLEEDQTGELIWISYSQINPILANIIMKMVKNNYQNRYYSSVEVLQDLIAFRNPLGNSQSNEPLENLNNSGVSSNVNSNSSNLTPQPTQITSQSEQKPIRNSPNKYQFLSWLKSPLGLTLSISLVLSILGAGIWLLINHNNQVKKLEKQRQELIAKLDSFYANNQYQECFEEAELPLNETLVSDKKSDYVGKCRFEAAQGELKKFNYALAGAIALKIPSDNSYYEQAQTIIKDASQAMFNDAEKMYIQEGKLEEALAKIETIPDERIKQSSLTIAQDWQDETEKNRYKIEQAKLELSSKNWQQAINIAETIYGSSYWQKEAKNIINEAKRGMEGKPPEVLIDLCDDPNTRVFGNCP